jgi:magnesium transporter
MESYFTAIESIDQEIDLIEAKVFKKADSHSLAKLFKFKQHVMDLKRHTTNHREVINAMAKRTVPFFSFRSEVYFRDTYDKIIRITDFIEIQREIVANIVETHTIVISNKMNQIIKVLTVITTIGMPATVIGTWYGMNFHYIPELDWKWSYPVASLAVVLFTASMLMYFKKKSWL